MSEKFSGVRAMREFVAAVAGPRLPNNTRESWLARAARRSGVSFRAAKALWYGETTDANSRAARLMRDAASREAAVLAAHYEMLARSMHELDQNRYRTEIDALVDVVRALRGLGRAGDRGEGKEK